jgi:predicted lipoprotein with Yx(FWY)xxD motif
MTSPDPYKAIVGGSRHKATLKATLLVVAAIVAVAGVIGAVAGAYALFHNAHPTDSNNTSANTTPRNQHINQPKPGAVKINNSVLVTQTYSGIGQYLGDPAGAALYTYSKDSTGVSNCSAACIASWPIYKAMVTTGLPANVTVVNRSDGQQQYAYKGKPLYYFSGDSEGLVTGDGLNDFHIAKP